MSEATTRVRAGALSTRERLIYLLWRNGVTAKEICQRRGLNLECVSSHIHNARVKLGAAGKPRVLCPWPPGRVWS